METSYANAGEISPGYAAPWAGPGVPTKALKWLLMANGPLVIKLGLDPARWRFLVTAVRTSAGELTADAFLVALGSYTPLLLRPIGI